MEKKRANGCSLLSLLYLLCCSTFKGFCLEEPKFKGYARFTAWQFGLK